MQETTIVGMIPMQETTNIVANVKDIITFNQKQMREILCKASPK